MQNVRTVWRCVIDWRNDKTWDRTAFDDVLLTIRSMSKIEKKNEFQQVNRNVDGRSIQYIDTPSSAALNTIEKKNQIHFDRSIDSEWKENQIPKKEPVAGGPINVDFYERVGAVDDDAEPF